MDSYFECSLYTVESKSESEYEEELICCGVSTLSDRVHSIKKHTEDIKKYLSDFPSSILTL